MVKITAKMVKKEKNYYNVIRESKNCDQTIITKYIKFEYENNQLLLLIT